MIDGVYASQGGSEDGLYFSLNWMTEHGGQLDNVEGGSTVEVYVTTMYNVKYYLDDVLITENDWVNSSTYTTLGTFNALTDKEAAADYLVKERNNPLAEYMPGDNGTFKDQDENGNELITRGEYQEFLYTFSIPDANVIDIAKTPKELAEALDCQHNADVPRPAGAQGPSKIRAVLRSANTANVIELIQE